MAPTRIFSVVNWLRAGAAFLRDREFHAYAHAMHSFPSRAMEGARGRPLSCQAQLRLLVLMIGSYDCAWLLSAVRSCCLYYA